MKSRVVTRVTRGEIFDHIGLTGPDATVLRFKADLLDTIRSEIDKRGYSQRQLVDILDEHQPAVSNLIRGRIAQVSIEKLLRYSDLLGMRVSLRVLPATRAVTVT